MRTKNNFTLMILSSVICLLPLILSFVVYNDLPEQIAVQWSNTGDPTNIVPKAFAAFGMPLIFTVLNVVANIALSSNPKRSNVSSVMMIVYKWLVPFISVIVMPIILFMGMGVNIPVTIIVPILVGILLIVVGNYLPKCRQNYIIGIKLPWTLNDIDNWNKTHRMAGYLWISGGMVLIVGSFLIHNTYAWIAMSLVVLCLIAVIPLSYSYALYKRDVNKNKNKE